MQENEVVNVINILDRDIEPGEITWDGQDVLRGRKFKAGSVRAFAHAEAVHIAKKLINFEVIGKAKADFKLLIDEKYIEEKMRQIIKQIGEEEEEIAETPTSSLSGKTMKELREIAKEKGVEVKFGMKKSELVKSLEDDK